MLGLDGWRSSPLPTGWVMLRMGFHNSPNGWHRATAWLARLACALPILATAARAADEIHWTMMSKTSVAVDWRGPTRTLRYGLTSRYGRTALGYEIGQRPTSSPGPFWEALIPGLKPDTTYHYSIDGGPDHTFHGLPGRDAKFTVFAEGDIGESTK